MSWTEQDPKSRTVLPVSTKREHELDEARATALPQVLKEQGGKGIETVRFQPVISPGIYEAEFAVKGADLIFHFWPHGYRRAVEDGKRRPEFKAGFKEVLERVMSEAFTRSRLDISFDADVGAWFIKARKWGDSSFFRELAIRACEALHLDLGGQPG